MRLCPLQDITVPDLTHVLAGPFASIGLAHLSAKIINVERPGIGDDTRTFPPFVGEESAYFSAFNAGKRSIAIDLRDDSERERTGVAPGPADTPHPTITPFDVFHASDGLFVIATGNDALFATLFKTLDLEALIEDPRFATNGVQCENERLLKRHIEQITLEKPRGHWIALLEEHGVPTGAIQNVAEAMQDPHILARNMVLDVPRWSDGHHRVPGNPLKITDMLNPSRLEPAPKLDGDRQAILDWLAGEEGRNAN